MKDDKIEMLNRTVLEDTILTHPTIGVQYNDWLNTINPISGTPNKVFYSPSHALEDKVNTFLETLTDEERQSLVLPAAKKEVQEVMTTYKVTMGYSFEEAKREFIGCGYLEDFKEIIPGLEERLQQLYDGIGQKETTERQAKDDAHFSGVMQTLTDFTSMVSL